MTGSNKITKDLETARRRTHDYALSLESARARIVYKAPGSQISNELIVHSGSPYAPGRAHVIIIEESHGY